MTLTQTEGARELVRAVQDGRPYAAGKLGSSEFHALVWYTLHRRRDPKPYPRDIFTHMVVNAGLFPARPETLDEWCIHMIHDVLPYMDFMAEWLNERHFLNTYAPDAKRSVLRSLEPYYESDPSDRYTLAFPSCESVAIISPFTDSIAEQKPKLPTVWPHVPVWSVAADQIHPIKTYFSPLVASSDSTWPPNIPSWIGAVDSIVSQVVARGTKYALIGCGALSLPIAVALKRAGCIAIHTGGATQILFGIKGGRWDTHSVISGFYNTNWIRPAAHEIPERATAIERGCYF